MVKFDKTMKSEPPNTITLEGASANIAISPLLLINIDMTIKPIAPRIPIMVAKSTFPPEVSCLMALS